MLTKLKNILSEIHLVLTPDREYGKVFERIPIVGFRRAESLKDILVRERKKDILVPTMLCIFFHAKHVLSTGSSGSFRTCHNK